MRALIIPTLIIATYLGHEDTKTRSIFVQRSLRAFVPSWQNLQPQIVDTPSVKVLKGLTAPEFEAEMQQINVALGVACGFCHVRGNFASDENPRKATARRMLEMTQTINRQFFADYRPSSPDESRLGRVTCYTCHQGEQRPKKPEL